MDIAIFSDSHGNSSRMADIIDLSGADAVIFLGDGIEDIEKIEMRDRRRRIYTYVRGNCDSLREDIPTEKEFEFEGIKFLILHGHTLNVKHGTGALEKYARSRGADIVLYGHTHTPDDRYLPEQEGEKPLRIFNPGSIGGFFRPTFGLITVSDGQLITNCTNYKKGKPV